MIPSEKLYPQPETVHIEKLEADLNPFSERIQKVVEENKIVMLGEEDHFDKFTPEYTFQVFKEIVEASSTQFTVCLEVKDRTTSAFKHFQKIVDFCEEKGIKPLLIDTERSAENNLSANVDNATSVERDIKMLENIQSEIIKNPSNKILFIGGSSHCNKSGRYEKNDYEEIIQENLASLLVHSGEKVGTISLHVTKPQEPLARKIDETENLLSLPGKYAQQYYQKRFLGFSGLMEAQWHADENSFDIIAFVPTQNSLINRQYGHPYDRHTTYFE